MTHPPQPSGWPDQPWKPPVPGNPNDPTVGQPVSGQPVSGQPVSGQPVFGQPTSGQPVFGQPTAGAPTVPPNPTIPMNPAEAGQPYTTPPSFDAAQTYGPPPSFGPPPGFDPNQPYAAAQPPPAAPYDPNQAYAAAQPPPAAPYDPNMAYAAGQTPYGGYGYPAYGPGAFQPAPRTNGLAIASLVVSIVCTLGLCAYGVGGLLGFVGSILGHVARRQIRERGESGAGMALAGVIIGWIATGLGILVVIGFVWLFNWLRNMDPSSFN